MSTLDLFAEPLPAARRSDPPTSHAAAESMADEASRHRRLILAVLTKPMTIYEIGRACGLSHVQVARRLSELEGAGRAAPTGETRPGDSGRQCRVWALTGRPS